MGFPEFCLILGCDVVFCAVSDWDLADLSFCGFVGFVVLVFWVELWCLSWCKTEFLWELVVLGRFLWLFVVWFVVDDCIVASLFWLSVGCCALD